MSFIIHILADYLVVVVALLGGWAYFTTPMKDRYQETVRAIMMGLTALFFAKIASLFYQGERPFMVHGLHPGASFLPNAGFPSDHALLVFSITFIVWATTQRKGVSGLLLVLSLLVGIGRILAMVHTPLDILGGFACAFLAALCWYGPKLHSSVHKKGLAKG